MAFCQKESAYAGSVKAFMHTPHIDNVKDKIWVNENWDLARGVSTLEPRDDPILQYIGSVEDGSLSEDGKRGLYGEER